MQLIYTTNIDQVIFTETERLRQLKRNVDPLLRELALDTIALFKDRIHVQGRDANREEIGTYSDQYLLYRQDIYKRGPRIQRGPKRGEVRTKFNRLSDSKVILSLTRQLENDYQVSANGEGYGLGFSNEENYVKATENEERYKRPIFKLSSDELALLVQVKDRFFRAA